MKCYVLHEVCDNHSVEFAGDVIVVATSSVLHHFIHSAISHAQDMLRISGLLSVFLMYIT